MKTACFPIDELKLDSKCISFEIPNFGDSSNLMYTACGFPILDNTSRKSYPAIVYMRFEYFQEPTILYLFLDEIIRSKCERLLFYYADHVYYHTCIVPLVRMPKFSSVVSVNE